MPTLNSGRTYVCLSKTFTQLRYIKMGVLVTFSFFFSHLFICFQNGRSSAPGNRLIYRSFFSFAQVDKLRQLETQRVHTFQLMLEKEQLYLDALRCQLAKNLDKQNEMKIQQEISGAARRITTLQEQLKNLTAQSEHTVRNFH